MVSPPGPVSGQVSPIEGWTSVCVLGPQAETGDIKATTVNRARNVAALDKRRIRFKMLIITLHMATEGPIGYNVIIVSIW